MDNFDAGFEKYIIFHRGVASASFENVVDENGQPVYRDEQQTKPLQHLILTYQDGAKQDLGDPYGDAAREYAEQIAEIASRAQLYAETVGTAKDEVDRAFSLIEQLKEVNGIETIEVPSQDMDGLDTTIEKFYINFAAVDGVEKDTENNSYYTNFSAVDGIDQDSETDEFFVQFDNQDGVEKDDSTGDYYVNFDRVDGIEKRNNTRDYFVDFDTPLDNVVGVIDDGTKKTKLNGINFVTFINEETGVNEDKLSIDYTDLYEIMTNYTNDQIDAIDGLVTYNGERSIKLSDNWAMTKLEIDMITGMYESPEDAAESAAQKIDEMTEAYQSYVEYLSSLVDETTEEEEDSGE